MNIRRFILLIVASLAAFAGGWLTCATNPNFFTAEKNDSPSLEAPEIIRVIAQGRILPTSGIYNVFAPPGQRIEEVLVKENTPVFAGKTQLVVLQAENMLDLQTDLVDAQGEEAATELQQKILLAESNLAAARSAAATATLKLTQTREGVDLSVMQKQIQSSREKISRLQKLQSDPLTSLYISQGEIADKQLSIEQAQSQLQSAKRNQQSAIEAAELGQTAARASLKSAERSLASLRKLSGDEKAIKLTKQIAEDKRDSAKVETPVDGTVLKILAKQGDVVTNTPLMQIADLSSMECLVEVVDRLVGNVKKHQEVVISSPALPRDIHGTVSDIGRTVGNSKLQEPNPLAMVDRKTVDVRVKINQADIEIASRLVNLQVAVKIVVRPGG
jgi:HlyD family secretion protein